MTRATQRRESDPLFAMDDEDEEEEGGNAAGQARRRKKDDKVPFTPEVSRNFKGHAFILKKKIIKNSNRFFANFQNKRDNWNQRETSTCICLVSY